MDLIECLQDRIRELESDLELHERFVAWAVAEAHQARRCLGPLLAALQAIEAHPAAARDVARSVLAAFRDGTPGKDR